MYLLIAVLISIIGALLFVFAGKMIKTNKPFLVCTKVFGIVLVVFSLLALYMLLSEKITLPLSANRS